MSAEARLLREHSHYRSWERSTSSGLLTHPTGMQRPMYRASVQDPGRGEHSHYRSWTWEQSTSLSSGLLTHPTGMQRPMYRASVQDPGGFTSSQNGFHKYHIRYPESSQRMASQCESPGAEYSIHQQPLHLDNTTHVLGNRHDPVSEPDEFPSSRGDFRSRFELSKPDNRQTCSSEAQDWNNFHFHPTHYHSQQPAPHVQTELASPWCGDNMDAIVLRYNSTDLQGSPDGVPATSVTAAGSGVQAAPYSRRTMHKQTNFQVGQTVGVTKKKKSKMHECEKCHKLFPRPSGLRTHMNTHNNVKPFACIFPGCNRSFTVRSNAKRHLRTHGLLPEALVSESPHPEFVNYDAPMVPHLQGQQFSAPPPKLKWKPTDLLD